MNAVNPTVGERPKPWDWEVQKVTAFHVVMVSGTVTWTASFPESLWEHRNPGETDSRRKGAFGNRATTSSAEVNFLLLLLCVGGNAKRKQGWSVNLQTNGDVQTNTEEGDT